MGELMRWWSILVLLLILAILLYAYSKLPTELVPFPVILLIDLFFLCLCAIVDQYLTYKAVTITTEAIGKELSEKREINPIPKFLWRYFSYELSAIIAFIIQVGIITLVIGFLFFTRARYDATLLLSGALLVTYPSLLYHLNYKEYRDMQFIKKKYPKDYKKKLLKKEGWYS